MRACVCACVCSRKLKLTKSLMKNKHGELCVNLSMVFLTFKNSVDFCYDIEK